jgi:hypothetical protein
LATPVPTYIDPLVPELAVPVLRITFPLTPDCPEFDDDITTAPLDVDVE